MKIICTLLFYCLAIAPAWSQASRDSIQIKHKNGFNFRWHGTRVQSRELVTIVKLEPSAYAEMKIARTNDVVSNIIGSAGAFGIGWEIGTAIGGHKANWAVVGIGAGLVVISIPFTVAYGRHARRAIRIYNDSLKIHSRNNVGVNVGFAPNGLKLKLRF